MCVPICCQCDASFLDIVPFFAQQANMKLREENLSYQVQLQDTLPGKWNHL